MDLEDKIDQQNDHKSRLDMINKMFMKKLVENSAERKISEQLHNGLDKANFSTFMRNRITRTKSMLSFNNSKRDISPMPSRQ